MAQAPKNSPNKRPQAGANKTPARKPVLVRKRVAASSRKLVAIYALTEPGTDTVRYIGKANNPEARLKTHLRDARRRDTPVCRWIRKLAKSNALPEMTILAWTDEWQVEERKQISQHRAIGCRLLNVAEGGDEPECSYETRAANGRKAAASRDPVIWAYKRKIGGLIKELERQGSYIHADKLRACQSFYNCLGKGAQRFIAEELARREGDLP